MRSPAATRLLALPRFFCFFTGWPPLMALCGAKVMCETNCFSVGNMLKSVPYSLSTNWTVSTPIASIPAKSTPLIRYSAWRRGSFRSELLLGRKHAQVCAIFAEHQLDGFHTDRIDPGQVHPADPVQRLAQGFFPALFDRLRLFRVAQFRRCLPAALFQLHLCQLPHNFPLILRDALLDGVVHLQGLPQREQVVRNARDGKDGGLAEGEKRRIGSDGSHGGILGRAA